MRTALIATWALLFSATASAQECGDVAQEGRCDGTTRVWCNSDVLITEECSECCGWDGNGFDCLDQCPGPGECIDECLEGTAVFGCSLHNTHEWTCSDGADGCTKRTYVKCGPDEICDEAVSHKCRDKSEVDLCGGVSAEGKCDGLLFKQCVAGEVQVDDCAAKGQTCIDAVGCSADCVVECVAGESGCESEFEAWDCTQDVITGCQIKVFKSCGAKKCYEGRCRTLSEIEELENADTDTGDDDAADTADDATDETDEAAPPADSGSDGCAFNGVKGDLGDMGMTTLATILGLIVFMLLAHRRRRRRTDQADPPP